MAPGALIPETEPSPSTPNSKSLRLSCPIPILTRDDYGDFRDELNKNGFAVVKGAIPRDRAVSYQESAYAWIKSFSSDLDFNNPATWIEENLPRASKIRTYGGYCVAHEKFMWDARLEDGVLEVFERMWGTDELLVSFDSLNITFPNRPDLQARKPWEHIDQSPVKRGVHCVQGIISLSSSGPEDGGLVVYPKSHLLNDKFFAEVCQDTFDQEPIKDIYLFKPEELAWFEGQGLKPHKVCADVGDLILWDSRTIHYGSDPTANGKAIRTAIYATYTPARLATADQLALKRRVFESYGGTTHWPHQHIVARSNATYLEDGTRDPRDREEPLEKPVMTDKLLKLAGVKPY